MPFIFPGVLHTNILKQVISQKMIIACFRTWNIHFPCPKALEYRLVDATRDYDYIQTRLLKLVLYLKQSWGMNSSTWNTNYDFYNILWREIEYFESISIKIMTEKPGSMDCRNFYLEDEWKAFSKLSLSKNRLLRLTCIFLTNSTNIGSSGLWWSTLFLIDVPKYKEWYDCLLIWLEWHMAFPFQGRLQLSAWYLVRDDIHSYLEFFSLVMSQENRKT